jgi:putative protein-disulfide isomerase
MNPPAPIALAYMADPMCSWCWGFSPVIEQLRADYADQLPFDVVMGGLRAGAVKPLTAGQRRIILHHWSEIAAYTGAAFATEHALPDGFVYDTEPACRAVVVARQMKSELALPMLKTLHAAFYAEGRDVTRQDVLVELAAEAGLNAGSFEQAFDSEQARQAARSDFARAAEAGVTGYPSLCVTREGHSFPLITGYQPLAQARQMIDRVLDKFG